MRTPLDPRPCRSREQVLHERGMALLERTRRLNRTRDDHDRFVTQIESETHLDGLRKKGASDQDESARQLSSGRDRAMPRAELFGEGGGPRGLPPAGGTLREAPHLGHDLRGRLCLHPRVT